MNLLLDTCTLLWFLAGAPQLSSAAAAALADPANTCWVSPISLLEIAIKVRTGKLLLHQPFSVLFPAELAANDLLLLPIEPAHIEPLTTLPLHHRDPFDRLIASTALAANLTVVSADAAFGAYGLPRIW